jgi:hypothetical protein
MFGLPVKGGLAGEAEVDAEPPAALATGGGAGSDGFTARVADADKGPEAVAPFAQAASRPTTRSNEVVPARDRNPVTIRSSSP